MGAVRTFTVTVDVTVFELLIAVKVYVVVADGETEKDPDSGLEPTPWSITTVVAPSVTQERVTGCPKRTVGGVAEKESMIAVVAPVDPESSQENRVVDDESGVRSYVSASENVPGLVGENSKSCRSTSPAFRLTGRLTGVPLHPTIPPMSTPFR